MKHNNCLVVQTAFLGDLLLSIPLLKNIRAKFPNTKIHLVCRLGFGQLLLQLGLIDRAFEVEKSNKKSYTETALEIQKYDYDFVLSPHESFRSALLVRAARADIKVSFKKWWTGFFFDSTILKNRNLPESLRQLSLMTAIDQTLAELFQAYGAQVQVKKLFQGEKIKIPEWASAQVDVILDPDLPANLLKNETVDLNNPRTVAIFPGSVWATKQWPTDYYTEVASDLVRKGHQVLIMGAKNEVAIAEKIHAANPAVKILAGRTQPIETLQILKKCQFVITNDSAGGHFAAIVGVKTYSIFGPTVIPFGYRPWNEKTVIIENVSVQCRPCGKHGHNKCPIGTHECMISIKSSRVISEIEKGS